MNNTKQFKNFSFKVVKSFKADPNEMTFSVQHGVADLDQTLDQPFLMNYAVENNGSAWNIEKVTLVHSFIDSTIQD